MASKFSYDVEAQNLVEAIDIAIESLLMYMPKGLNQAQLQIFIDSYRSWKQGILAPSQIEFRTARALKDYQNDIFTYFQEDTGQTVNHFWRQIKEANLPYKRVDVIEKILKRGRIARRTEYEVIKDVIVAGEQAGDISANDAARLGRMIDEYELSKQRKS